MVQSFCLVASEINRNSTFISVITADATEIDLTKTQEIYRKMGETLVINELKFEEVNHLNVLNLT